MDTQKLYWHFAQADDNGTPRLVYGDGREVKVGETLTVEGEPVLCRRGLHASARLLDAIRYANGERPMLCRVQLGGEIVDDDDGEKSAANERTVLAMLNAAETDKLLRDFARWCALQVIHLWDAPDVVREYLETDDESLRDVAREAARGAITGSAWPAAWAAARGAAWDVAGEVARGSAWIVVWDAAWDAARAAARDEVGDATLDEAWLEARDDARDDAIERYAAELEQRGLAAIE